MARPYSLDLRERVVARVAGGDSCRKVAALFGVSVASVVKWSQRWRATGSAAARPMGASRGRELEAHRAWLLDRLTITPHVTVRALAAELTERGIPAGHVTVWRVLKEAGFSFKKNAVRQRAGQAKHRAAARAVEEVPGKA